MVLLYSFHNKCMLFLFMRLFCCIYTQISKKEVIRTVEIRCTGDIKYIMQIQRRRNYRGAVCADHVHMCVSIPPKISISSFMGYLKGKSTLMIYDRHPEKQSRWNKAFWAGGYYVATVGNITEDAIKKYIREQSEESRKEESEGAAF